MSESLVNTVAEDENLKRPDTETTSMPPEREWTQEQAADWIAEKMLNDGISIQLAMQEYLLFRKNTNVADVDRFLTTPLKKRIEKAFEEKKQKDRAAMRNVGTSKTKPKRTDDHPLFPEHRPSQNEIKNSGRIKGSH